MKPNQGSIWRDGDPRADGRTVTVLAVGPCTYEGRDVPEGKCAISRTIQETGAIRGAVTLAAVKRFNGTRGGYVHISG